MAWRGKARRGRARRSGLGAARRGWAVKARLGMARRGRAGRGGQTPLTRPTVVHNVTTMQGHRQSLTLTQPQRDFLSAEAARLGVTVSEVVRRIVDQYREARNA